MTASEWLKEHAPQEIQDEIQSTFGFANEAGLKPMDKIRYLLCEEVGADFRELAGVELSTATVEFLKVHVDQHTELKEKLAALAVENEELRQQAEAIHQALSNVSIMAMNLARREQG